MSEMLRNAREAQEGVTMDSNFPYWLQPGMIIWGAEEENSNGSDDSNDSDDDSDEDGSNDDSGDGGNEESGTDESNSEGNTAGLKKALQEERRKARESERKLKKIERDQQRASASKDDLLKEAQTELETTNQRVTKLSNGFLNLKLNAAIEAAARKSRFRDTDDALSMVDRSLITYDQDEDNPSDVDIDLKSVESAVKKLAGTKKHLIAAGTDDGHGTGGQFGTKGGSKKTTEEELRAKYPNL